MVDLWYLKLWMGEDKFSKSVDLVTTEEDLAVALNEKSDGSQGRIIAIQAVNHEILKACPIDFVINIASMQEMDISVVEDYFSDFRVVAERKKLVFYCCNREEKVLPDGSITKLSDYPWSDQDVIDLDELCPWHQHFYSFKPPFFRSYDGPIRHRLVTLSNC